MCGIQVSLDNLQLGERTARQNEQARARSGDLFDVSLAEASSGDSGNKSGLFSDEVGAPGHELAGLGGLVEDGHDN